MRRLTVTLLPLALVHEAGAIDNGLGLKPPLGWRSWNLYADHVDQPLIESIMDGMVSRKRLVDGKPTSLCDLGYCDVGLDDAWQACGGGNNGYQYHAQDANGKWHPVLNLTRFPDMKKMTDKAHSLGLTAGWYQNNCICGESKASPEEIYAGDVEALIAYGYDAVKLDGCGTETDLDTWARLLNATGKPIMIENCHWGQTTPNATWCPWNFFRSSGDIYKSYASMVSNLQTTIQWAKNGLSKPGCWAYPDMLEVGCGGMNSAETRAHFGAWAIVSAPLTLSMDVNNDTVMDEVWDLITNRDVLAVNQAWDGHSGSPFKESNQTVVLSQETLLQEIEDELDTLFGRPAPLKETTVPSWQYFYKPTGNGKVAVLLMNHGPQTEQLKLLFSDVPGLRCAHCTVYDLWARKDLGIVSGEMTVSVGSHDAAFFEIQPPQHKMMMGPPRRPPMGAEEEMLFM